MSNSFNAVLTLGRDAEVRQLNSGKAVLTFTGANNVGWGERKKTLWLRCSVFGPQASGPLVNFLKKGVQVAVAGELSVYEYIKDGQYKQSLELTTVYVDLVGNRKDNAARNEMHNAPQPDGAHADYDDDIPF